MGQGIACRAAWTPQRGSADGAVGEALCRECHETEHVPARSVWDAYVNRLMAEGGRT